MLGLMYKSNKGVTQDYREVGGGRWDVGIGVNTNYDAIIVSAGGVLLKVSLVEPIRCQERSTFFRVYP